MNIYLELTKKFNTSKLRSIISSGQAAVLHHIAIMSKDGDWILKEGKETINHVLSVLSGYGAKYRFGAPLDIAWLSGGWSSHFEFFYKKLRIRTDFVTRPPRISENALKRLWDEQKGKEFPFIDIKTLSEIKKTNREKDYVIIGELARLLSDPKEQLLYSRSARDIIALAEENPEYITELVSQRPLLIKVKNGVSSLEEALDAERRELIHLNEKRLEKYMASAGKWQDIWPEVAKETEGLNLIDTHNTILKRAKGILPYSV